MHRGIKGMKTMHEHDIERIAEVAEQRLTGEELAAALAEINSCNDCRPLLEQQRLALEYLGQARPVMLTAAERRELHQAFRRAPARSGWLRLAPAFAAAAAVAVVVGIFSLPGTTGNRLAETGAQGSFSDNSGENVEAATRAPTTVAAAATTTTMPSSLAAPRDLAYADLPGLAEQLRAEPRESSASACGDQASDTSSETLIASIDITLDGTRAVMFVYPDVALVFDTSACTLVDTIPANGP
jgi:hypothetical protein